MVSVPRQLSQVLNTLQFIVVIVLFFVVTEYWLTLFRQMTKNFMKDWLAKNLSDLKEEELSNGDTT